jgi:hypothetical protein
MIDKCKCSEYQICYVDTRTESMQVSPRCTHRYEAFYDAYYQELLAASVIERWQRIDLVISLLVAITASGSAISGLTLWSTAWGKPIWALLATTASLGAICHTTARVPNHLQQEGEARRDFSLLRGKLQIILYKMISDGDNDDVESEYQVLRGKLVELTAKLEPDIAATLRLRTKAQSDLQGLLKNLGVTQKGILRYEGGDPGTNEKN